MTIGFASFFLMIECILLSSALYMFLHFKTRISLKFIYLDNIAVIFVTLGCVMILGKVVHLPFWSQFILVIPLLVLLLTFGCTMIRFWRTPSRVVRARENEIVSPADGNIIYIKKVEAGDVPVSIKSGRSFYLNELTNTDLLNGPCWLIGINMTPFDVHKNCSPIAGTVLSSHYSKGKFLSLKDPMAELENERNTYVIGNSDVRLGIVQIASRLVRKIDVYVVPGEHVAAGQWLGMIRFGSQVDVILPIEYGPTIRIGQQVYAASSVIAMRSISR